MEFEKVRVWDAPMGTGKTSKMISVMNQNYTKKYIFITPILDEVERIIEMCPNLNFVQPSTNHEHPTKTSHLLELLKDGRNIVSTHSLFLSNGYEMMELLANSNYTLVLDEVVSVLSKYTLYTEKERAHMSPVAREALSRRDIDGFLTLGLLGVADDHRLVLEEGVDVPIFGKYDNLKQSISQGLLYYIGDSALMWSFPVEIFEKDLFDEIYILTYQFDVQMMGAYFRAFDVPIEKYSIIEGLARDYVVVPFSEGLGDAEFRDKIKDLITIVQSKRMNRIGEPDNRTQGWGKLNYTWWEEPSLENIEEIGWGLNNLFTNIAPSRDENKLWTSFKKYKKSFRGDGASVKNWLTFSARATNNHRHKEILAYLVNRFYSPSIKTFFSSKSADMKESDWALSEMLQWIFRSRIRDGKPITIWIPSRRMRNLLEAYLNNEPLESIYKNNDLSRRKH